MFKIVYHHLVVREDIPKLSSLWRRKIKLAIEDKLVEKPEIFGKPLAGSLRGYRKLRVHDYRVIFIIDSGAVKILAITHRSRVYKYILRRI